MRNMETGTKERLLQLEVRNSAHMILAHRRVSQTCLGTHLRLLRFLSHSSLQRWEVEDGFGEKLLGCAQLVTKVPRTPSPGHMELTQRSWSCLIQIWAIWGKKLSVISWPRNKKVRPLIPSDIITKWYKRFNSQVTLVLDEEKPN